MDANQKALIDMLNCPGGGNLTQADVDAWLEKNPPPKQFSGGKYEYAYLEMPVIPTFFYDLVNIFRGAKP